MLLNKDCAAFLARNHTSFVGYTTWNDMQFYVWTMPIIWWVHFCELMNACDEADWNIDGLVQGCSNFHFMHDVKSSDPSQ